MIDFEVNVSANFKKESKRLIKKYRSLATEITHLIDNLKAQPEQGTAIGRDCY